MLRRRSLSDINSLKRQRNGKGPVTLACFPPRHPPPSLKRLTAPKPIRSPGRGQAEPPSHHRKSVSQIRWGKSDADEMTSEPTSPKVTCAGQIKVRSRGGGSGSWQSVMQEIERIHIKKETSRRQLLTCLRNFRFDFRCFGSIHQVSSDDEEDEEEEEYDHNLHDDDYKDNYGGEMIEGDGAPPANALLLMRCRSAPLKRWLQEEQEVEKEKRREAERLVVMRCSGGDDFSKLSDDIVKETWVGGEGIKDILARSRSWKR